MDFAILEKCHKGLTWPSCHHGNVEAQRKISRSGLLEVPCTRIIKGIQDQNLGNCSGSYGTRRGLPVCQNLSCAWLMDVGRCRKCVFSGCSSYAYLAACGGLLQLSWPRGYYTCVLQYWLSLEPFVVPLRCLLLAPCTSTNTSQLFPYHCRHFFCAQDSCGIVTLPILSKILVCFPPTGQAIPESHQSEPKH